MKIATQSERTHGDLGLSTALNHRFTNHCEVLDLSRELAHGRVFTTTGGEHVHQFRA